MGETSSEPAQHVVVRKTRLIKYVREENWTTVVTASFIHRVHALFNMVYIMEVRVVQIFQKPWSNLKIVGTSRVTSISTLGTHRHLAPPYKNSVSRASSQIRDICEVTSTLQQTVSYRIKLGSYLAHSTAHCHLVPGFDIRGHYWHRAWIVQFACSPGRGRCAYEHRGHCGSDWWPENRFQSHLYRPNTTTVNKRQK